ncbi:MAG: hypothetical protein R2754_03450 [Microthrixaceae bacterium]
MNKWGRRLGVAALAIVAALGIVRLVVEWRDRSDPVDVSDLAAEFDSPAGASPRADGLGQDSAGPVELPVGVWSYAASGTEYVDVLGGPLHEFPDQVAQSITNTACGQTIEVTLFEQRADVLELCWGEDGALRLDRFETRHEFVGVADVTVTDGCGAIDIWWPGIERDVGSEPKSVNCTAEGNMSGSVGATVSQEVVAIEEVDTGAGAHEAVRVKVTSRVGTEADPTHGVYDAEFWFGLDDGVILRRTLDAEVNASTPVGAVRFEESFDITADDIDPLSS